MRGAIIQCIALTCLLAVGATGRAADMDRPEGRLPGSVVPQRYDLSLSIIPERPRFSGELVIDIDIREPVSVIWMHGRELAVSEAELRLADGASLAVDYEQVTETGLVRLELPREIEAQSARLAFTWTAPFNEGLDGLYRVVEDGEAYAFTQFEPIAARKVFPGFDEPRFKTPFALALTVKEDHAAITATPETGRRQLDEGRVRIEYANTKALPTYLIAFAVGPLDVVAADPVPPNEARDRPLPLRGVAVKGRGGRMQYALERTGDLLQALEQYTGIGYPYAKLDVIAVPDFQAGAMENVGAVTFREYLLLMDDGAPAEQRRAFASVMAHELAHFWFGNLVTMPWWDDIWLNEAFSTWFAAKGVQAVYPEHRPQARLFKRVLDVMSADSLVSARRIRQPIESSNDIHSAFDGITYSKGAAVLGMFERYVGEERFRQGVRDYLRSHAHGTAEYRDFLDALGRHAGRDVGPAFESFLLQSGVPMIEVSQVCDGDAARMTLRQSRYLPLGSTGDPDRTWGVPVCLRYGGDSQQRERCTLLNAAQRTLSLDFCPEWVVPNAGGAGYYRWHVGQGVRAHAPSQPAAGADRVREQMAWADSLQAAVRAGREPIGPALGALTPVLGWPDPLLAGAPVPLFRFAIDQMAANEAERSMARSRLAGPMVPVLIAANLLPSRRPATAELRDLWLGLMTRDARMGVLMDASAARAERWLAGEHGAVDADVLGTVLNAAALEGNAAVVGRMADALKGDLSSAQRSAVVAALGYVTGDKAKAAMRALAFSDTLRSNEIEDLLAGQASLPETRAGNWRWIRDEFDRLREAMPAWHLGDLPSMTKGFCDEERAEEVEAFFEPRIEALEGGPRSLAQALEAVRVCAAVAGQQRSSYLRWLGLDRDDSTASVNELGD